MRGASKLKPISPLKLDLQKVYDCLKAMPLKKLTTANSYEYKKQYCLAGWVGYKLLSLNDDNKFQDDNISKWRDFLCSKIIDMLTDIHIKEIVTPKEMHKRFSKAKALNIALAKIQELIDKGEKEL